MYKYNYTGYCILIYPQKTSLFLSKAFCKTKKSSFLGRGGIKIRHSVYI